MTESSSSQDSISEALDLSMDNIDHNTSRNDPATYLDSMTNAKSPHFGTESQSFSKHDAASGLAHSIASPQHQFNLENFDFGADFCLPNDLDEMTIFQQHQHHQSNPNRSHESSSRKRTASGSRSQSFGGPSSNEGSASSPHNITFSPGSSLRDQQQRLQGGRGSRTQSPHPLSMTTNSDHGQSNTGPAISNSDLQSLLMAVQGSTGMLSQHSQEHHHTSSVASTHSNDGSNSSIGLGNMSFSELEKYLAEKEQTEKLQIMQTAFLRQQLESLQRQQQNQSTSNHSSEPRLRNLTAAHLMQQFKQMSPQQEAMTPTQQHPLLNSIPSQSQSQIFADSMKIATLTAANNHSQKANNSVTMTQYGLATPLSSGGAFTHQGAAPFVSPIHMPSGSSTSALLEHQRAYDAAMSSGTFTPLESPAVTPASVFSAIGSSTYATAANSQDIFSPLTSPALRPEVGNHHDELMLPPASPFYGPVMTRGRARNGSSNKGSPHVGPVGKRTTTPSASPVTAPIKSIPRKNRSTTAEARANRARPSPLVKPGVSNISINSTTRKRGDSNATSGMPSPLGVTHTNGNDLVRNNPANSLESQKAAAAAALPTSTTTYPPLSAGDAKTKSMDASPSEGAASTPSPIDLNTTTTSAVNSTTGKPMTPGSVMGINSTRRGKTKSTDYGSSKQVSFAGQSQGVAVDASFASTDHHQVAASIDDGNPWLNTSNSSTKSSGGGGIESRRTSHKAAEQKRRDSLKYCFDELRGMLPAITLDDDVPGGSSLGPDGFLEDQDDEGFAIEEVGDAESARLANRAISKVALLRHSNEYLIRLKNRLARRDRDLDYCRRQVMELRSQLGYPIESRMGGIMVGFTTNMNRSNFVNESQGYPDTLNHMDIS